MPWQFFIAILMPFLLTASNLNYASAGALPGNLPACETSPRQFQIAESFYFSADFSRDQVVFVTAVYPEERGWRFYRSDDGGRTWGESLAEGVGNMAFSPNYAQDHTILALPFYGSATEPYIWRSQDRGATWEKLFTPPGAPAVSRSSPMVMADTDTIYFGRSNVTGPWTDPTSRGFFRFTFTSVGAAAWEQLAYMSVNDIALSPDFAHDQTVFIGQFSYKINLGLLKSTDGGRTWRDSDAGIDLENHLNGTGTTETVFAPGYPADAVLFAATDSRYYRSMDQGATWQPVYLVPYWQTNPDAMDAPHWVLSPRFTSDRHAWIEYGKVMTADAGDTWQRASSVEMSNLAAREWCEGERCGVLLLGAMEYGEGHVGVYKSFDLGRTWHCSDEPTPAWWPDVPPVGWTFFPVIAR